MAVFGIRPCDVHGIVVLDRVMLGHDNVEGHYEKRRNAMLILALRCNEAGENCFCESMGTCDLDDAFDLLFTDEGSHYHVQAGSEEGERLVKASRLFEKTGMDTRRKKLKFSKSMNTKDLPEIMNAMKNSAIWKDVADRCLSCASCTFACPTCYCFNMSHEAELGNLKRGKVEREMDYCMLLRYSRVAGGHVFRKERKERVKQFFYHKLAYGKENEGKFHCVGCGRCITECMAKIDITEEVGKIRRAYAGKG